MPLEVALFWEPPLPYFTPGLQVRRKSPACVWGNSTSYIYAFFLLHPNCFRQQEVSRMIITVGHPMTDCTGGNTDLSPWSTPCQEAPQVGQLLVWPMQWGTNHSISPLSQDSLFPFTQETTLAQQAFLALPPEAFKEKICQDRKVVPY